MGALLLPAFFAFPMNSQNSATGRIRMLQQAMARQALDALLVTQMPDIRYLCGFTGSSGAFCASGKKAVLFTDGRYTQQARQEVSEARVVIANGSALAAAADAAFAGGARIGFDDTHLTVAQLQALKRQLRAGKAHGTKLIASGDLVRVLRMRKDRSEIAAITAAVQLASSLFPVALKTIRPGIPEFEVAARLEYAARRAGAAGMSFDTIVASGKRSALPHGAASSARLPSSGFVVLDFGVILAGYCSDMTRTVSMGRPNGKLRALYDAVLEAQLAAIAAVRPGTPVSEVDEAARVVLRKAKLAKYFTHSTGHGVGLEIHESPRIGAGQKQPLEAGMIITIEPGVYIPGLAGVRIEDMVAVTATGCRVLTPTSKELIVI